MAEMATVLALVTLLAGSAITAVQWTMRDWRVREAAISLASELRAARTVAITDRNLVSVPFDVQNRAYARAELDGTAWNLRSTVELPPGVSFARPDSGDSVTLVPPSTTDKAALFDRRGHLSSTNSPGDVYLGNVNREVYFRVRVNVAGGVVVERWDGAQWK